MVAAVVASSGPKTARKNEAYYPALDGVRGVAVSFVLLSHAAYFLTVQSMAEYLVKKTLSPLWFGVNIFFVLSGFLITGILLDSKDSPIYFRSFYVKRTLRIFPLYFSTLFVAFLVLPALGLADRTPFSEQVYFWTYLYNWHAISTHGFRAIELGHFWTLAIEEQFYLVWPFVVFIVRRQKLSSVCLAVGLGSFCFRAFVGIEALSVRYAYFATPAQIGGLCLGGAAACAMRDPDCLELVRRHAFRLVFFALALIAGAAVAGRGFESNKVPPLVFGQTGVALLSALVILLGATNNLLPACERFLTAGPIRWLGKYSYGIYVFHVPIRNLIIGRLSLFATGNSERRLFVWLVGTALMAALSSLAAYLSFTFYESRFLRLKERVIAMVTWCTAVREDVRAADRS